MSKLDALLNLCERWRLLSEREGKGIHATDWNLVAACQSEKQALQGKIPAAAEALRRAMGEEGAPQEDLEACLGSIASQLLALEHRNRKSLCAQLESARGKTVELQEAFRNLQRLHQAYRAESQPLWHSFS